MVSTLNGRLEGADAVCDATRSAVPVESSTVWLASSDTRAAGADDASLIVAESSAFGAAVPVHWTTTRSTAESGPFTLRTHDRTT